MRQARMGSDGLLLLLGIGCGGEGLDDERYVNGVKERKEKSGRGEWEVGVG